MKGKNVLELVQSIKEKKDKEVKEKDERKKQKEQEKEAFFRCRKQCVCGESVCAVINLQECPSCHNVQRSACSKSGCKEDGKKPKMILPAAALNEKKGQGRKRKFKTKPDDTESDASDYSEDESNEDSDEMVESDTDDETFDPVENATKQLLATWKSLSPPVSEDEIKGKWFAVAYAGKRRQMLIVGKILNRFLVEKDGEVDCMEMKFLKPKVGLGNMLEDTPEHLPDISNILLKDIIAGPLNVTPHGCSHFIVTAYKTVEQHFRVVSNMKRQNIVHSI